MAGDEVTVAVIFELGLHLGADVHTLAATSVEFAALWRMRGGRDVALQDYTLDLCIGIGNGDRRKQRLRIGMHRVGK